MTHTYALLEVSSLTYEEIKKKLLDAGYEHEKALKGAYDDFKSDYETPIMDLVRDCRAAGLNDIVKRAINGDFDATKKESEAWFNKEGRNLI